MPTSSCARAATSTSGSRRRSKGPGPSARVLTLSDHVRTARGDPHWWQDPRNAIAAVAAIERALGTDAARYTARLRALDRSVAACIARIPVGERKLVTTHDALGYYARRYGLDVIGAVIPSRSTRGAAFGRRDGRAGAHDPRAGRGGDLRRELGQPEGRARRSPARPAPPSAGRCGPTRSVPPARTARPTSARSPPTPSALVDGPHRRPDHLRDRCLRPSTRRSCSAPWSRACCWRRSPACSARWIVLRRLAFFTHGVGTAAFPGLVIAAPAGVAPQLTALAAALALRRRGGRAAAPARGHRRGHRAACWSAPWPSASCSPPTSTRRAPASTGCCSGA